MERALLVWEPQRSALEAVGGSHGEQTTHQDLLLEAESLVLGGSQTEMYPGFLQTLGLLLSTGPLPKADLFPPDQGRSAQLSPEPPTPGTMNSNIRTGRLHGECPG